MKKRGSSLSSQAMLRLVVCRPPVSSGLCWVIICEFEFFVLVMDGKDVEDLGGLVVVGRS